MQHARFYFVLLCLTAVASISFAQTKAKALGPDEIVAKLYKDQKAETGPFNQTKSRALVDRFFMEDLADMIWKDAVAAKGEIGAIDFDPLFGSRTRKSQTSRSTKAAGPVTRNSPRTKQWSK